MVTLSSTISYTNGASIQALTITDRGANHAAIRACVKQAVADGAPRRETDQAGLATLFEGLLVGFSVPACDGV
jgi:hypothetical protein